MTLQRQFNLQPTRCLAIALIIMHGAAIIALMLLVLPLWAKLFLLLLLLASLLFYLRRDAWLSAPSSATTLVLDGDWVVLTTRNGKQITGQLMPHCLVTPFLTVLNILPQGVHRVQSIIILPDSLDAESFRQLRVNLLWGR